MLYSHGCAKHSIFSVMPIDTLPGFASIICKNSVQFRSKKVRAHKIGLQVFHPAEVLRHTTWSTERDRSGSVKVRLCANRITYGVSVAPRLLMPYLHLPSRTRLVGSNLEEVLLMPLETCKTMRLPTQGLVRWLLSRVRRSAH